MVDGRNGICGIIYVSRKGIAANKPSAIEQFETFLLMTQWQSLFPYTPQWLTLPEHVNASAGSRKAVGSGLKQWRMHYVDQGAGSDCILCVHGNPTWSFYFREVVSRFQSQARVVAVDHIGCGLSDKPQVYPYCLQQHIANLVELIRQLDLQKVTLVVHDWGGAIGLGAALEVPERISGLVILNTAAFPPPYIPLRIAACRVPFLGNWAMRGLNLFVLAALRMTLHRLPRLRQDVAAGLIAPYDNWAHRVGVARFVQDIPLRPAQPTWELLALIESRLPLLNKLPTEIVWGMRDWCFRPECMERIRKVFVDAKVTLLEDVGHYVMEEAGQEVLDAIGRCLSAQGSLEARST